jgi:hypothetical protein
MDQEEQDIENLPDGQELPEASPIVRTPSVENSHLDKDYSQVGSNPIGSISTLLKHAPFFDYISHIASCRYPGELEEQLETLEAEHRRIYVAAIIADYMLRILLVTAALAVIGIAIYKLLIH